eukprot:TRINITY_DN2649_c0_g2_i2.p1 TRINITY_DN2649_c0_g2~~TRINITY_DN2649_c0_g2_i2.p1  ORF type:complete len:129 (+),score=0.16 TRINITY_DN2649_c0_g2_i2:959-1345(+)
MKSIPHLLAEHYCRFHTCSTLFVRSLLVSDNLLPTSQTQQVKTECFLILAVIDTSPALHTTCNAKRASPAWLLFPLAALHWTIINNSQILTSGAHLEVNGTIIVTGQVAGVKETWTGSLRLPASICVQ